MQVVLYPVVEFVISRTIYFLPTRQQQNRADIPKCIRSISFINKDGDGPSVATFVEKSTYCVINAECLSYPEHLPLLFILIKFEAIVEENVSLPFIIVWIFHFEVFPQNTSG